MTILDCERLKCLHHLPLQRHHQYHATVHIVSVQLLDRVQSASRRLTGNSTDMASAQYHISSLLEKMTSSDRDLKQSKLSAPFTSGAQTICFNGKCYKNSKQQRLCQASLLVCHSCLSIVTSPAHQLAHRFDAWQCVCEIYSSFNVLLGSSPAAHHVKLTAGLQVNATVQRLARLLTGSTNFCHAASQRDVISGALCLYLFLTVQIPLVIRNKS